MLGGKDRRQFGDRRIKRHLDGVGIDRLERFRLDGAEFARGRRCGLGIKQALERVDHVVSRQWRAIVELHALAQFEGPFGGLVVRRPRFRKPRDRLHGRVGRDERLIDHARMIDVGNAEQPCWIGRERFTAPVRTDQNRAVCGVHGRRQRDACHQAASRARHRISASSFVVPPSGTQ